MLFPTRPLMVAEMVAKPNVVRLKEELGTDPRVYYLI